MEIARGIGWVFTALAAGGIAYTVLAVHFLRRLVGRPEAAAETRPTATILKPLHGAHPALEPCLETFFRQDYPAPVEIVFGVGDAADPAVGMVDRLCRRHPKAETGLVASARRHGPNAKASNLANMRIAAHYDLLAVSDDDIAVAPDYLGRLAAALSSPGVGAATCLYTGYAAGGFGSRLAAMGVNYHFLPNVATGLGLGLATPCMGSTIALKREVLDEIGGFAAVADYLADDYEIGRRVRGLGYRIAVPPFAVRHACLEAGIGDWFGHELRWMRTIRITDPAGHWGSIVTNPLPLALIGTVLLGFSRFSLGVLAATIAARAVLKWRTDKSFGCSGGPVWLLPIRDVLSFGVFLASLGGKAVVWQGEALTVTGSGRLIKH